MVKSRACLWDPSDMMTPFAQGAGNVQIARHQCNCLYLTTQKVLQWQIKLQLSSGWTKQQAILLKFELVGWPFDNHQCFCCGGTTAAFNAYVCGEFIQPLGATIPPFHQSFNIGSLVISTLKLVVLSKMISHVYPFIRAWILVVLSIVEILFHAYPVINVADLSRIFNLYFQGHPVGPAILIDWLVSVPCTTFQVIVLNLGHSRWKMEFSVFYNHYVWVVLLFNDQQ